MKQIIIILITFLCYQESHSQFESNNLAELPALLEKQGLSKDDVANLLKGILKDPELYNDIWKDFLALSFVENNNKFKFLRDLDIQFKTFQSSDTSITALGFSYDFKFDFTKFSGTNSRTSHKLGFSAIGNVAFNKNINPNDFLESRFHYKWSVFKGGVLENKDTQVLNQLTDIDTKLTKISDIHSAEALALWEESGKLLRLTNQFYFSAAPKFALESNQDFSKKQFTPGIIIGFGAKGWNTKSLLSKLNILDYPFALFRLITGTDRTFTPYGSTLPTIQFQFDYVIPSDDDVRTKLVENSDPYPRFKFEAGFRTFISRIRKENIFFNANIRCYHEFDAKEAIKNANLDKHTYFVMALQSTTGMYVSYSKGKLPFDAKDDEVYSIGFNYKL